MFDDLSELYQQVILDHCKHPRNFHELGQPTCSAQGHNPLCVGNVGKLAVFAGVHKFPARVKCAILAWHAVMAALKGQAGGPVTTESEDM